MTTVLLAHGLEGHPNGRKPTALRGAGFDVVAPDGRKLALAERIHGLLTALSTLERPICVGSSYGGLAMLAIARDHPDAIGGLVLCAPALSWSEPPAGPGHLLIAPPGAIVLHGLHDTIIPIAMSRDLIARSPKTLLYVCDDDHRLAASLDTLVTAAQSLA